MFRWDTFLWCSWGRLDSLFHILQQKPWHLDVRSFNYWYSCACFDNIELRLQNPLLKFFFTFLLYQKPWKPASRVNYCFPSHVKLPPLPRSCSVKWCFSVVFRLTLSTLHTLSLCLTSECLSGERPHWIRRFFHPLAPAAARNVVNLRTSPAHVLSFHPSYWQKYAKCTGFVLLF